MFASLVALVCLSISTGELQFESSQARPAGVQRERVMPSVILEEHDPVWEAPPPRWLEGIPLANGHIGALIWGDGRPLKITLDKYDAWETREKPITDKSYAELRQIVADGKREESEAYLRTQAIYGDDPYPTRLPLPRIEMDLGENFSWGEARLNLLEGRATLRAQGEDDNSARVDCFVHAVRNVVRIQLSGFDAVPQLKVSMDHLDDNARQTLAKWGYPEPEITGDGTKGVLFQATPSGYSYAVAWDGKAAGDGWGYAVAIVSSEDAPNPREAAQQLAADNAGAISTSEHTDWWHRFWQGSKIDIPDKRLEALYYFELYKLACSSRPGGLPVTLQGLWTLDGGMPPWSGDYHLDMNVQQSYWPIYTANLLELGESLYRAFSDCLPRWKKQYEEFYGGEGIWAGCAIGPRGERIYGYSGVEIWLGNHAWLAQHYWLHYLYSQDETFLREQALPMLRLSFLSYANILEEGDDGRLHVPMSYSPEYGEGGYDAYIKDPAVDIALIQFLGRTLLECNKILGEELDVTPRVNEVLASLIDLPRNGTQLLVAPDMPLAHSHRHHSHLMAIHPLALLDMQNEGDRAVIRDSLRHIRVKGTGEWTGWAFPWMSLIASRAELGNMAWNMLDQYADGFIVPNTFHINGDPRVFGLSQFDYNPMTLEAGFGAAAGVLEMLLQSHNGLIRVFPSIPDRWHDAYFENLRAEGAFVVTAKLSEGGVTGMLIFSEAGKPCRVRNPWGGDATLYSEDGNKTTLSGEILEFDTMAQQNYRLSQAGAGYDVAPTFDHLDEESQHFYGTKRLPRY